MPKKARKFVASPGTVLKQSSFEKKFSLQSPDFSKAI